jgi:hypothetical protein
MCCFGDLLFVQLFPILPEEHVAAIPHVAFSLFICVMLCIFSFHSFVKVVSMSCSAKIKVVSQKHVVIPLPRINVNKFTI